MTRRSLIRGRVRLVIWLVLLMLVSGSWWEPVAAQDEETIPAPPEITADAAFALDIDAGQPLYALNPDERLAPASTTKIATALVVVQNAELTETVTIVKDDLVDTTEFSNMGLAAGDTLTVELLLYGLLLPSGNDAANALARYVGEKLPGGDSNPPAAFVQAMNELVAELGLENTHFVNPAGEDAEDHYSSARDMAVLGGELLNVPSLATIVATSSYEGQSVGPEARVYVLSTTNTLLGEVGIIGIKTGITEKAGGSLVTGAEYASNRVVTVVLGSDTSTDPASGYLISPARYDDTLAIIGALNVEYDWIDPASVEGLEEAMAAWQVTLGEGPDLVVPAGEGTVDFDLRLGPEGSPSEQVGTVVFLVDDRPIAERPLYQI
ncbi:MAG TPA: serine hydrolase [Thermomicrobiales bacterium]|nr:serine hydrolase [Thermomicrobiales bacterium]